MKTYKRVSHALQSLQAEMSCVIVLLNRNYYIMNAAIEPPLDHIELEAHTHTNHILFLLIWFNLFYATSYPRDCRPRNRLLHICFTTLLTKYSIQYRKGNGYHLLVIDWLIGRKLKNCKNCDLRAGVNILFYAHGR